MPLAQLKPTPYDHAPPARSFAADAEALSPVGSPAQRLQQRLEAQIAPDPVVERWPIGRSVALIVASSVALWAAILEAGAQAIHLAA